ATGRWTLTGSLRTPRRNHTATLLPDGTVLVAGGSGDGWLRSAELYDPARGRWSRVAPMTTAREHANAILLGTGRVLVAGGGNPSALRSAELYDPASGQVESDRQHERVWRSRRAPPGRTPPRRL